MAQAVEKGESVAELLDTQAFGLVEFTQQSGTLPVLLRWTLRGASPGRSLSEGQTTYAEDLILTALTIPLQEIIKRTGKGAKPPTLNSVVAKVAAGLRETVAGQFITSIQSAEAIARVSDGWYRKKRLAAISRLLTNQVKTQFDAEDRGEVELPKVGTRRILSITDPKTGEARRIEARRPAHEEDWLVLEMAAVPHDEEDGYASEWTSFALLLLCVIQRELGWFAIGKGKVHKRSSYRNRVIELSKEAEEIVMKEADRWAEAGLDEAPMLVPPQDGAYVSVEVPKVSARRTVRRWTTDPSESDQWKVATQWQAQTAFTVNTDVLAFAKGVGRELLPDRDGPAGMKTALILAEHSRLAEHQAFWLPIFMDFRGRIYPRTNLVTYQGSDLQKGLLAFADYDHADYGVEDAYVLNITNAYGHGQDKASMADRRQFVKEHIPSDYKRLSPMRQLAFLRGAEEPFQLHAILSAERGWWQARADGTCNGLQHLSAMFRDGKAGPLVNLTDSEVPSDLYAKVAATVAKRAEDYGRIRDVGWSGTEYTTSANHYGRWSRLKNTVTFDRKLTKRSVMVLPYGGTLTAVRDYVTQAVLDQQPDPKIWQECRTVARLNGQDQWVQDKAAVYDGYLAFKDRELEHHPLFKKDMEVLADQVWQAIKEEVPLAMKAMDSFRKIASMVEGRVLEWQVSGDPNSLAVRMARSKASMKRLRTKGFHMPASVRTMGLVVGSKEVDRQSHINGIVANFIHSHDADHLMRTFDALHSRCMVSTHDSIGTCPRTFASMQLCVRSSFVDKYQPGTGDHPLDQRVRILNPRNGEIEMEGTWRTLAYEAGCAFPDTGKLELDAVRESTWFFS